MNDGQIKSLWKRLASVAYHHKQGSTPDIFVFSTQRSGSTLLFDMCASQAGVKAVGEPLQERKQTAIRRYVPTVRSRYSSFDQRSADGMERYIRALLRGEFVGGFERSYNPRNPRHHYRTDRNAIKILRATQLLPWFLQRFDGRFVLLLRHPIPVALSRARNGWHPPVESFTSDVTWFDALSPQQRAFVEQHETDAAVRRHILVWCLEHVGILNTLRRLRCDNLVAVTYETFLQDRERVVRTLGDFLEIADRAAFSAWMDRPSRSSKYSEEATRSVIETGGSLKLIDGWVERTDTGVTQFTREALKMFQIDLYDADSPFPRKDAFFL